LHFWVNYVDLGRSFPPACQGRAPEDPDCGIRLKSTPQELRDRLHAPGLLARAAEEVRAFVQRQRQPDDAGPEIEADPVSRRPRIACWVRQEELVTSLRRCLAECEHALDAKLIERECAETPQAEGEEVLNPSSPRAANSVLYDAATTQLIAERDGALLAFFGYNATDAAQADRWRATLAAAMARRAVRTLLVPPAYRST